MSTRSASSNSHRTRAISVSTSASSTPLSVIASIVGENYKFIAAVTENRMREIGVAIINITRPEIELSSFTDTYSYIHLLSKLTLYNPYEFLLPRPAIGSELHKAVEEKFPQTLVVPVARKYFDEAKGSNCISQLAINPTALISEISDKYLCLAACAALVKYAEYVQKISYAPNSIKIYFAGREGTMVIDSSSLWNLEVLCNSRTKNTKESLYGVINYTKTVAGGRLLRVNMCQPPNEENTINTRLDCVEELLNSEAMYFSIVSALKDVPNLDRVVAHLVTIDKQPLSEARFEKDLSIVLHLKQSLERFSILEKAVAGCKNELLKAMKRNFGDRRVEIMKEQISEVISSTSEPSKQASQMRIQQCYAIRPGIDGLLDVARKTFGECVEDIHNLTNLYKTQYKLDKLQLQYNHKRGYFLGINKFDVMLPEIFIQVNRKKKSVQFSTEELISLNDRQKESVKEIMQLTNRILEGLFLKLRTNIACIYNINDTIALLDLITSFATFATLHKCVRPVLLPQGPTEILGGRHPIVEKFAQESFVANNTVLSEENNFYLITGPNMSGKSTYIRQIALLTIMAQIGCFVSADSCQLRITDHLFTRIGTSDCLEDNASSFMVEMRDMAYILQNYVPRSLIIIDELGRGTSICDGCALAWSFCEALLLLPAYTLFVTHFFELYRLSDLYPNVNVYHLGVQTENSQIKYSYKLQEGRIQLSGYGIALAESRSGFPPRVIELAKRIGNTLNL